MKMGMGKLSGFLMALSGKPLTKALGPRFDSARQQNVIGLFLFEHSEVAWMRFLHPGSMVIEASKPGCKNIQLTKLININY